MGVHEFAAGFRRGEKWLLKRCYRGVVASDSTHADYNAKALEWSRARDVLSGEDAVKAAGKKYLPRLDAQSDDEYAAYMARASFFGATARTHGEYLDLVFRRAPAVALGERKSVTNTQRLFFAAESPSSPKLASNPLQIPPDAYACHDGEYQVPLLLPILGRHPDQLPEPGPCPSPRLGHAFTLSRSHAPRSHAPTLPRSHAPTLPRSHAPTPRPIGTY